MSILMDITNLVRELALYYATIGFIISITAETVNPLYAFGTAVISGVLSILLKRKRPFNMAPVLIMGLLIKSPSDALYVFPVMALLGYRAYKQSYQSSYSHVLSLFKTGMIAFILTGLAAVVYIGNHGKEFIRISSVLFMVFVICSVFELRMLKDNAINDLGSDYLKANIILMAAVTVIVILAGTPVMAQAIRLVAGSVYNYVIIPVIMAITYVIYLVLTMLGRLLLLIKPDISNVIEIPRISDVVKEIMPEITDDYTSSALFSTILKALGIIILIIAVIYVVRKLAENSRSLSFSQSNLIRESIKSDDIRPRKQRKADPDSNNPVRMAYRQYLQRCAKAGLKTDNGITSWEIARQTASLTGSDEAEKLRQLWLPERYSFGSNEENSSKARELVKTIRNALRKSRKNK